MGLHLHTHKYKDVREGMLEADADSFVFVI